MATARRRRPLFYIWLTLFILLFIGIGIIRSQRKKFDAPESVRDKVLHVRTPIADFYGARIGDSVVLFDDGADPDGRALDALLTRLGRTRDDVSDIFLTHGHGDHIAATNLCSKARIHGGIGDSDMMSKRGPIVPRFAHFMGWVIPVPAVMLTDAFLDKSDVKVGSEIVKAIPFAGHTPGSMLYVFDGVLFSGDSMIYSGGKLGYAPVGFNVDLAQLKKRVAALAGTIDLSTVKTICTGHGGCTPEGDTQRLLADLMKQAAS
jgi:glyoxylase-like metal-dependent hydrolase (beta-lactamase superfamily II)